MFETDRLCFRAFNLDADHNTLIQWELQHRMARVHVVSAPRVPPSPDYIKTLCAERSQNTLPMYTVCLKPKTWPLQLGLKDSLYRIRGPHIGVLNFMVARFDIRNRDCDLAMGIPDPQHRGQGYGLEIIEWAFEYGFMELGLHRMSSLSYSFNDAALELWRKMFVPPPPLKTLDGPFHD
ncbi:hypothetical protein LTR62_006604 [Meristemomyces frigidus]|uniref:N-acetyltransferase domain-containing protein n=1 Tax=Meristemomyces frigidus TaxID=1508187 RepID=A0AAN7YMS6_9PEZI|nr:hypothetical protein LTR62_006604 [Meristemomyces frigidus]